MRARDARRSLHGLWRSWRVQSCADGTLRIRPQWRNRVHGVLTRMYAAQMLYALIRGDRRK